MDGGSYLLLDGEYLRQIHRQAMLDFFGVDGELDILEAVAEFAARWREEVLAKRKPSTVRSANSHLDSHILPQLGKLRLDQVGPENQQVFVNQLAGASRKTTLNILSTLSSMLATAKNWGYSSGEIALRKLVLIGS